MFHGLARVREVRRDGESEIVAILRVVESHLLLAKAALSKLIITKYHDGCLASSTVDDLRGGHATTACGN